MTDTPDGAADRSGNPKFLKGLGERVRTLRARRGMTRRLLASQSGVSERYIAQMEAGSGNASVLLLRAIATALGVAPATLLADESADGMLLHGLLARLDESQLREARSLLQVRFAAGESARRGRVALIGLRGGGKSTLGRMLAGERNLPFIELDRELERTAGLSIGEIVEVRGQGGYRRLEREVLEHLLAANDRAVIAAGGSIVAESGTFELLLANCLVVWIKARPELHMQRVIDQGDTRPMAGSAAAMDDLRAILRSREGLYGRADLTLDTSDATVEESFARLSDLTR